MANISCCVRRYNECFYTLNEQYISYIHDKNKFTYKNHEGKYVVLGCEEDNKIHPIYFNSRIMN
jgi:hypothetical protein